MQAAMISDHPGKAEIVFLSMIDMSDSDPTGFASLRLREFATDFYSNFDFRSASLVEIDAIIANASESCPVKFIVLKLGGFYTLMSFLGANLMSGLGLSELLHLINTSNIRRHIFLVEKLYLGQSEDPHYNCVRS